MTKVLTIKIKNINDSMASDVILAVQKALSKTSAQLTYSLNEDPLFREREIG